MRLALRRNLTRWRRPWRRGITVAETMVAIVILGVGVMGLASTAGFVAMQMGGGGRQTVAATVSQQVFDSLAGVQCKALVSGSDSIRQVGVQWVVTDSNDAVYVQQTLNFRSRRGLTRTVNFSSLLPCRD